METDATGPGNKARAAGLLALAGALVAGTAFSTPASSGSDDAGRCLETSPSYYAFDLIPTKRVPGTGLARGRAEVVVPEDSPFSVALGADGSYRYTVRVRIENAKPPRTGRYVAWAATPDLDRVRRLGTLDQDLSASGSVIWNKYIVVVSLESGEKPYAERWSGPVAFRGVSRSGAMHTMVGHGALQQENCAAWGY